MGRPAKSRDEWLSANDHLPRPLRRDGAIQDAVDSFGLGGMPGPMIDHFLRVMAIHGFVLMPLRSTMTWKPLDLEAVLEVTRRERAISQLVDQQDAA